MPPVTNTRIPAAAASSIVALTVVAPSSPSPTTTGTSRRDTLRTAVPARAMCSSCAASQPAMEMAVVATAELLVAAVGGCGCGGGGGGKDVLLCLPLLYRASG
jgi:hypothetical protein